MKTMSIIFIPGLLCDERVWSPIYNVLSDSCHCYIASWENGDTVPAFIERVLNMSPGKIYIFGHAMGGMLALLIALYAPERVGGLCIVNSSADADSPDERESRINMMKAYQLYDDLSLVEEFAKKTTLKPSQIALSMMLSNHDRLISQQCFLLHRSLSLEKLHNILCPVLLVHSEFDNIKNHNHSKHMHDHLPNSVLKTINNSGHMTPIEQPMYLIQIIKRWITEHHFL
ncbi:MAG: hypothetical protein CL816_01130 [Coxiellaceae bacterium]|nr:hypothetical protein [Coxiellaceae bacterium]